MEEQSQIQQLINIAVRERSEIWVSYDKANSAAQELEEKFSQYANGTTTGSIRPLTNTQTPPDEINAVISKLNEKNYQISAANEAISLRNSEIDMLKQRKRNLIITLSVLAFLAIATLIFNINSKSQNDSKLNSPTFMSELVNRLNI